MPQPLRAAGRWLPKNLKQACCAAHAHHTLHPSPPYNSLPAESRRRFSPAKDGASGSASGAKPLGLLPRGPGAGSAADLAEQEERSRRLGATVDQLRELVKQGGEWL